jgi:hypothetical protein
MRTLRAGPKNERPAGVTPGPPGARRGSPGPRQRAACSSPRPRRAASARMSTAPPQACQPPGLLEELLDPRPATLRPAGLRDNAAPVRLFPSRCRPSPADTWGVQFRDRACSRRGFSCVAPPPALRLPHPRTRSATTPLPLRCFPPAAGTPELILPTPNLLSRRPAGGGGTRAPPPASPLPGHGRTRRGVFNEVVNLVAPVACRVDEPAGQEGAEQGARLARVLGGQLDVGGVPDDRVAAGMVAGARGRQVYSAPYEVNTGGRRAPCQHPPAALRKDC